MKPLIYFILFILVAGEGYLLFTGSEFRVTERIVPAGESLADFGLDTRDRDMLVCRNFNGTRLTARIYPHQSESLSGGRASCPWLVRPNRPVPAI